MAKATPSRELALALADTTLAAGLRYGRWVERAPSTEEQVAVSSMSQDKLGQARQFFQFIEQDHGEDAIALQYDRGVDAFCWNPAWLTPWGSWAHFVIAQVALGRALLEDLRSLADGVRLREPLNKIEQEDSWHARHGSAWLSRGRTDEAARGRLQSALDDLWPDIVGYFGAVDEPRFPDDERSGVLVDDDAMRRERWLDAVVPQLRDAGLHLGAERTQDGWRTEPSPTTKLIEQTERESGPTALELVAMLQDPTNRDLASI